MSYCLNPYCRTPQNSSAETVCQTCGTTLLLKKRYRAVQELGEGGMSRTFLAVDLDRLNTPCIIKQFSTHSHKVPLVEKAIELFNQEALRLRDLGDHPQIPALYGFFEQENHLYLVEEQIEGKNLLKELNIKGAFSEVEIIDLLKDVLPILTYIHHHQVIHRDIKPDNLIRRKVDGKLVLVDFGVAKQTLDLWQPKTGTMTGTIGYAPLEQIRGGKAYPASDLYSLGMTCIHLLTQVPPNQLFDPLSGELIWRSHLLKNHQFISKKLGEILDKLLPDMVKDRYQNAEEVLQDLEDCQPSTVTASVTASPQLFPSPLTIIVEAELQAFYPYAYQNYSFKTHNFAPTFMQPSRAIFPSLKTQSKTTVVPVQERVSLDCVKILSGHPEPIQAIAIGPNGYILVSGSQDKTLKIWNLKTGQLLYQLTGHEAAIASVAMSPNGRKIVSGSLDRTLIAWNLNKRAIADRFFSHSGSPYSHRGGAVYAVAYSPDGCFIVSGSGDQTLKVWNQRNGELLYKLSEHLDRVLCVSFAHSDLTLCPETHHYPQNHLFASGSEDGIIKLWKFGHVKSIKTLIGHTDAVHSLAFSPDQFLLISGSADQTLKFWNLQTGELIQTLTAHADIVSSVAISSDGKLLASGSRDGIIYLWNLTDPNHVGQGFHRFSGYPPVLFSPDNQQLICCDQNSQVLVWKLSGWFSELC